MAHEPFITVVRTGARRNVVAAASADDRGAKRVVAHREGTTKVIQSKENSALSSPVSTRGDAFNLQFLRIALRKIAIWGLGGSLVVHLILAALSAVVVGQRAIVVIVKAPEEEEPDVTMVLPKQEPKPSEQPAYMRSTPDQAPVESPAKPDFISDKNSIATSKDAPDPGGDPTLPSMKGTEASARELLQSAFRDGAMERPSPSPLSVQPSPSVPQSPPAQPQPMIAKQETSRIEKPQEMNTPPQASSQREDLPPESPQSPVVESSPPPAAPSPPTPVSPASQNSYSAQTEERMAQGGVTRRGDQNAVNAARTLAGEYYRKAQDDIGRRWNSEIGMVTTHMLPGTVILRVLVDKNGNTRPGDISVISGRAESILAQTAYRAVLHTKLAPLPEGMNPVLEGDKYEFQMNFNLR